MLGWGREEQEENSCGNDKDFLPRHAGSLTDRIPALHHNSPFPESGHYLSFISPKCTPQRFNTVLKAYLFYTIHLSILKWAKKEKKKKRSNPSVRVGREEEYRKNLCIHVKEKIKGDCSGNIKWSYNHVMLIIYMKQSLHPPWFQGGGWLEGWVGEVGEGEWMSWSRTETKKWTSKENL